VPTSALAASGLRLATVSERTIADTLMLAGQVEADPLRVAHLAPRVSGTIQRVAVVIGDRVRKGDLVAELYSPEFAAGVGDYLLAHGRLERARTAQVADTASLENIARSARLRLETLGSSGSDVARMDERHEPLPHLPLRSPISGVVTEVETGTGKQVQAGTDIFGFADLDEVWGVVDVYERDFGSLRIGQVARVSTTAYPGREFTGRIVSLEGTVKPETRTLSVRVRIPNRGAALKPGMFITARVPGGTPRRGVAVPDGALQELGGRTVVFVALTDSTFIARPVEARRLGGEVAEITRGLRVGERVASQGAFVLKSQASRAELGEE
jgi:RND family efflux transporter MFP subunit